MNRYAAVGLLVDALDGKRIGVLVGNAAAARVAMDDVLRAAEERLGSIDGLTVIRTNGNEEIRTDGGGRIRFLSSLDLAYGARRLGAVDTVLLEPGTEYSISSRDLAELHARDVDLVRA